MQGCYRHKLKKAVLLTNPYRIYSLKLSRNELNDVFVDLTAKGGEHKDKVVGELSFTLYTLYDLFCEIDKLWDDFREALTFEKTNDRYCMFRFTL